MKQIEMKNKFFFSLISLFIIPLTGFSIDIYVPSLPAISVYFSVDKALVQLTITFYMMGLGIAQLFAGGISDSFGRKKPCLLAMIIYIIATLFVPFAQNINQLLGLRLIQGVTVALVVVPMRSIISDLYEGREFTKMMIYMTMAWAIGPIIAPAIGGYLQHYFGWHASFYFLAIYASLMFLLVLFFLPETSQYRHRFHIKEIFKRYQSIVVHREFMTGLLIDTALYSLIILFSIVGPFLIQTVLHYSAVQYGHISLLMGVAWFLGNMTNRFLIDVSVNFKVHIGLILLLFVAIVMCAIAWFLPVKLEHIIVPVLVMLWIGGLIYPIYFARSLAFFPKISGSANAIFGSLIFLLVGAVSGLGTELKSSTALPLAGAYIGISVFCLLMYYLDNTKSSAAKSVTQDAH